MAQLRCIGLSWPLTNPPFRSCAIYFQVTFMLVRSKRRLVSYDTSIGELWYFMYNISWYFTSTSKLVNNKNLRTNGEWEMSTREPRGSNRMFSVTGIRHVLALRSLLLRGFNPLKVQKKALHHVIFAFMSILSKMCDGHLSWSTGVRETASFIFPIKIPTMDGSVNMPSNPINTPKELIWNRGIFSFQAVTFLEVWVVFPYQDWPIPVINEK